MEETFKGEVSKHSVGPHQSWRFVLCGDTITKCPPVLHSSCVTTCQQDFAFSIPRQQAGGLGLLQSSSARIVGGQEEIVSSTLWVTYCWQQMLKRGNCFLVWRDRNMRKGEIRMCWGGQNLGLGTVTGMLGSNG